MPLSPDDLAAVPLRLTADGVLIPVQAQPGARRSGITGVHNGRLKLAVTQAAEKGKANQALIEVLAAALDVPRRTVSLARGETSPLKEFCIRGLTPDDVRRRLLPRDPAQRG
jgi:uncharacterized protein (TIGR00251 family)